MEVAELQTLDFVIKTVGSLPLLRGLFERMGFAHIIDTRCPLAAQAELSCGTVTNILVANRLQAPKPLDKVEKWAREAGVEEVFGMPAERRNDDRLGRVAELLGQHAPALKGAMARHSAKVFQIGMEQVHGDLTPISVEGADEEDQGTP